MRLLIAGDLNRFVGEEGIRPNLFRFVDIQFDGPFKSTVEPLLSGHLF